MEVNNAEIVLKPTEPIFWPNPATYIVNIKSEVPFIKVSILTIDGSICYGSIQKPRKQQIIPTGGMHTGVYILFIEDIQGTVFTTKFAKL